MRRLIGCVVGVAALTVLAGACSSDSDQIEDEIVKALDRDRGIAAENVACPDDAKAKEGNEFDCTLEADGQAMSAHVVFRSDNEFEITELDVVDDRGATTEPSDASS